MILGSAGNCDAEERYRGYQEALAKNGLKFDKNVVIPGDFTARSGYYGFLRLNSLKIKPDAVFAANDMMAVGIYEAARSAGIKIPEDIAVVGFDDIYLSRLLQPRLTTVHVPIQELGSRAIQYLFKLINGEADQKIPHREELTTGLVIGGSCGCNQNSGHYLF
jgi:DNA-binding LacI/PurR family transcriptional regulator